MSGFLRIILIVVSVMTFIYISRKLKKSQLQVMDAFFWIVFSFVLMVIGVFPGIAMFFAKVVVQSPVNFVYLVVIFLLLLRTFMLTIRISFLEEKVKNLIEEIAIRENEK